MKSMFFAAAALAAVSVPAAAQITEGQYGDVTQVSGGYQIASDPASGPGYGGIYFGLTGYTLNDLTSLSANYTLDAGALAGGAPRFSLFDNLGGGAYIYFTNATSTNVDGSTTVECNGFGGCAYNYPGISFADFFSGYGATALDFVTLDVDAGYSSRQQITVSDFSLNGTQFGASTAAVPEPATWAMMLIGFGGVGFQLRRTRRSNGLIAQAA